MMQNQLHLTITNGSSDCDDCGGYEYDHFNAVFPDGSELHARHDGHLGGGSWSGYNTDVFLWCLAKLGYAVRINGQPAPMSEFHEEHSERGFSEYRSVVLFAGEPVVLELQEQHVPDPEYPSCLNPGTVTVNLPGRVPVVFETGLVAPADCQAPAGAERRWWDGEMESVYRMMLEHVVDLQLTVISEQDDENPDDSIE